MQSNYPDPADRILAYGEQLGEDADKVLVGAETMEAAQQCYEDAYSQLVVDFEAGSIKKGDAGKRHKEIQKGIIEISMVLADAQQVMDTNLQNYNEALTTETTGVGPQFRRSRPSCVCGTERSWVSRYYRRWRRQSSRCQLPCNLAAGRCLSSQGTW